MTERTGYESTEMTRRRLQAALFRAIDEKTRMGITGAHRDCWRYDQMIAEARQALQEFDLAAKSK